MNESLHDLPREVRAKGCIGHTSVRPEAEQPPLVEDHQSPHHLDVDPGALDEEERRSVEATYLRAPSAFILSENESPDVPFTYSLPPYKGCEYGCPYCYTRPSHEYWGLSAGLDRHSPSLSTDSFRRLPGEQPSLFGE